MKGTLESQAEKCLTVLMDMVIDGIPYKGDYFEQPIESEALRFLSSCDNIADAAVSAAAFELLVRKPSWSKAVWRGTLRAVVGTLPIVGTATAVFTGQFESLWRQIRFVALAATMYGHNPRDEATQCQILLCLLGDTIINPQDQASLGQGLRQGSLKVAVTAIAKRIALANTSSMVLKGALGGVLVGVMPVAVTSISNVVMLGKAENQEGVAKGASDAVKKVKEHFKMEEQPTLTTAKVAAVVFIVPKIIAQLIKFDNLAFQVLSTWLGDVNSAYSISLWYLIESLSIVFGGIVLYKSQKVLVRICADHQWVLATVVLYVRAFINFLAVSNTCNSFAMGIMLYNIYNVHRGVVGFYSLYATQQNTKLKQYIQYVHGSLLIWIIYSILVYLSELFRMVMQKDTLNEMLYCVVSFDTNVVDSFGFTKSRVGDAVDIVSTIALHVLVEQIRRTEVVVSLLGPVKVVDGLLFAAKSLGTFVVRPEQLLQWLDSASPPPTIAWTIFTIQYNAVVLGCIWGFTSCLEFVTLGERLLLCYAVLVTVPFTLMHRHLPEPYENKTWNQALESRHRLLFLIPELDNGVRNKLYFVIKFFERYEKAYAHTTNTWTSSVAWFDQKWAKLKYNIKNIANRNNEDTEFQVIEEEEVPYKEVLDQDNDDSYYTRFLRYLKNKQKYNMPEYEDSTHNTTAKQSDDTTTQSAPKEQESNVVEQPEDKGATAQNDPPRDTEEEEPGRLAGVWNWFSSKVSSEETVSATIDSRDTSELSSGVEGSGDVGSPQSNTTDENHEQSVENVVGDILVDLVDQIANAAGEAEVVPDSTRLDEDTPSSRGILSYLSRLYSPNDTTPQPVDTIQYESSVNRVVEREGVRQESVTDIQYMTTRSISLSETDALEDSTRPKTRYKVQRSQSESSVDGREKVMQWIKTKFTPTKDDTIQNKIPHEKNTIQHTIVQEELLGISPRALSMRRFDSETTLTQHTTSTTTTIAERTTSVEERNILERQTTEIDFESELNELSKKESKDSMVLGLVKNWFKNEEEYVELQEMDRK